jgi:hypothetical protein
MAVALSTPVVAAALRALTADQQRITWHHFDAGFGAGAIVLTGVLLLPWRGKAR